MCGVKGTVINDLGVSDPEKVRPYQEGGIARVTGKPETACPYDIDTAQGRQWLEGYRVERKGRLHCWSCLDTGWVRRNTISGTYLPYLPPGLRDVDADDRVHVNEPCPVCGDKKGHLERKPERKPERTQSA